MGIRKSQSYDSNAALRHLHKDSSPASPQRSQASKDNAIKRRATIRDQKKLLGRMLKISVPAPDDERALDGSPDLMDDLSPTGSKKLFVPNKTLQSPFSQKNLHQ